MIYNLDVTFYLLTSYFQKLILSQIKVPYVCQFLRKFQLDISLRINQKCQTKKLIRSPGKLST